MQKVAAFIVARQTSSRLPGKAMVEVLAQPVLARIAERLRASPLIQEIWFVTSTNPQDDAIAQLGAVIGVKVHRGHPEDVLERLYTASLETNADYILEVGGDCPLVDPALIEKGLEVAFSEGAEFTSNAFVAPFTYPVGYDFILISKLALQRLHHSAKLRSERHQPFQFIVKNPQSFKSAHFSQPESLNAWRWTMDYPEDLAFLRAIYHELHQEGRVFSYDDMVALLRKRPDIVALNAIHAAPVESSTAWYTGSFSHELTADIRECLNLALDAENEKDWRRVEQLYKTAAEQLSELNERALHFSSKARLHD
jgi:spore coat polysaccharide biosynthesis protein SpsF